jgi:hypothetical protein
MTFIVRGKNAEIVSEDFDIAQHRAYMELVPRRSEGADSIFTLVVLRPGQELVRCEAIFHRGCNALAMPSKFVDEVWGKEVK